MTGRRVLVINGHPDPSGQRYCTALSAAYRRRPETRAHPVAGRVS
jgi:putative NADPH-quinone reductase